METKLFGLNKDGNVLLWVNKDVTKFVIPDTVTDIKEWAFSNCTSLTSITIPSLLQVYTTVLSMNVHL